MPLTHDGPDRPSSHDIILRYVALLPAGVTEPNWEAARKHIDGLADETAEKLSLDAGFEEDRMDLGWTDEELHSDSDMGKPRPSIAESWRRYLHLELNELINNDWPLNVTISWKGRVGFLVEGYGFDEEPGYVFGWNRLLAAGVIEAAGYEILP